MPKPALLPCPADRREMLETIAFTLRGSALSDPFEDLAAWVVGVEVVEGLQRAGFMGCPDRACGGIGRRAVSVAHVSGALARLESLAAAGSPPDDVAHEAEAIAAGWWWNAHGNLAPERLALLVQELQRWCAVAARHHALRWDHLNRAGRPRDAGGRCPLSAGVGTGAASPARLRLSRDDAAT